MSLQSHHRAAPWWVLIRAAVAVFLFGSAVAAQTAKPDPSAEHPPNSQQGAGTKAQPDASASESAPDALLDQGVKHFRAGRYGQALSAFEQALAMLPTAPVRSTLEFNVAACLFELGRYDEAEQRFAELARTDSAVRPLALLNAGVSALRAGRLQDAERHQRAAPRGDAEAEARRAELAAQLAEARRAAAEGERRALVRRGAAALRQRRFAEALTLLRQARQLRKDVTHEELVDLHYGIGTAWYELGNFEQARREFEAAAGLSPRDGEVRYWAARSALGQGETETGLGGLEQALALGLEPADARQARAILEGHSPLPRPGLGGMFGLGVGLDSNPSQSGIADATGLSEARQTRSSAFVAATAGLHGTWPMGRQWAGRVYYLFDWLGMLRRPVQDLSLQAHEGGLRLYWAPHRAVLLRLTAGAALYYAGLQRPEPFARDLLGAGRADWKTGESTLTRLELRLRRTDGLGGRDYLSGLSTQLRLAERFRFEPAELWLGARLRHYDIGVRQFPITASTFPTCGTRCDGATYYVPLGYLAPSVYADLSVDATERLTLGVSGSVERRQYLGESYLDISPGVQENAKTRQDLRLRGGPYAELALDARGGVLLVAEYEVLQSSSTMALDPGDPEHALDYEDRNFVQHVVQVGVEVHF